MSDIMLGVLRMPPECWDSGSIDAAQRHAIYCEAADEIEKLKQQHINACCLVAAMHAAAMGEVKGPVVDVVADIEAVRIERDKLRDELAGKDIRIKELEDVATGYTTELEFLANKAEMAAQFKDAFCELYNEARKSAGNRI